jgi:HEAT repeat protein
MRISPLSLRSLASSVLRILAVALPLMTLQVAVAGAQATPPAASQDADQPAPGNFDPLHASKAELSTEAWSILKVAVEDKHADTRIQALAALGTMSDQRSTAMIANAMDDADLDVRTAAVLAAGLSKTTTLRGKMHSMLNDKEPQVAFAAATTLWKLNDRTGEDILMAVANGDRKANASMVNGAEHTINKDFHNPATLAKMGALQGASMLLGPFGFGITAYEAMKKNGGSSARVTSIEQLSEERTAPVRAAMLDALTDKDPGVRAAAAKALGTYHEADVATELSKLMIDPKAPVRFTGAAAYLRSVGASTTPTVTKVPATKS